MDPYGYCFNNPINLIDPTGMGPEDWVYNKETEEYYWDNAVTKPSDVTDSNLEYVGKTSSDVNAHYEKNNPIMSYVTNPKIGESKNGSWPGEISQHTPGFWENQSSGNMAQKMLYDTANGFSTTAQMFMGRAVGDGSMRNLDGSGTTTDQGVLGFASTGLTFLGGGFAGSATKSAPTAIRAGANLQPLGLGSTGRTVATNLTEQLAMKEAMSNPAAGKVIIRSIKDPRWTGWSKMQYIHTGLNGNKTIIHYLGKFEKGTLKYVDDFKFK